MEIKQPYLLFLGDAPDTLAAKTAHGIAQWRPEFCIGQFCLDGCKADLGLPELGLEDAREKGAKTLVIGVANRGGKISDTWQDTLVRAIELGFDIAAGLHQRVGALPRVAEAAQQHGATITDVRHPEADFDVGTGAKRSGRRVLTVGTDCSVGKMFTALAVERAMKKRGMNATFRATGQTGILISGSGVPVDAIVSDFMSGAIEALCPENDLDHWDIIEGQGSLFHPSYAGVSLGLLHGAQADALIMCHEPTRAHMRGLMHYKVPDIQACIDLNEACARLTNPKAKVVGLAVNASGIPDGGARIGYLADLADKYGMPAVDPVATNIEPLIDAITAHI